MKQRHFPVVLFFTIQGGFEVSLSCHLTLRIYIQFLKCVCIMFEMKGVLKWLFMAFVGKFITKYRHHPQMQVTSSLILAKSGQLISPFRAWYSLEGKSTPGRRLTFINNSYYFTYKGRRCFNNVNTKGIFIHAVFFKFLLFTPTCSNKYH